MYAIVYLSETDISNAIKLFMETRDVLELRWF